MVGTNTPASYGYLHGNSDRAGPWPGSSLWIYSRPKPSLHPSVASCMDGGTDEGTDEGTDGWGQRFGVGSTDFTSVHLALPFLPNVLASGVSCRLVYVQYVYVQQARKASQQEEHAHCKRRREINNLSETNSGVYMYEADGRTDEVAGWMDGWMAVSGLSCVRDSAK